MSDTIEVWDGQVSLVVDHLLNHIKVLAGVAEGPADQTVLDVLTKYPHYQVGRRQHLLGPDRESVTQTLIEECVALLECLAKIAPVMEVEQAERTAILEATRAVIPFLDYHHLGDRYVSDAQREDFDWE